MIQHLKTLLAEKLGTLPGRAEPIATAAFHAVSGRPLKGPYPAGLEQIIFAMGCYWGAERQLWRQDGVWVTAVGNCGGKTPNPSYEEVCTGRTGHAESVLVVFDPLLTSLEALLKTFWEGHDPTQGNRQGNDVGSQYRSAVFWMNPAHERAILASRAAYQRDLTAAGYGAITTTIERAGPFYFAEAYHQQYLAKNPNGYCGLGGTGVTCAAGIAGMDDDRRSGTRPDNG